MRRVAVGEEGEEGEEGSICFFHTDQERKGEAHLPKNRPLLSPSLSVGTQLPHFPRLSNRQLSAKKENKFPSIRINVLSCACIG